MARIKTVDWRVAALLLFISAVSIFPHFINDFIYWQDDLMFHRTRLESYYEAVKHWDLFPRVFANMGQHYGYAADLFYPSLLLLPFALFRLAGLPFVQAFFLYQFVISLTTAIIAYSTTKKLFGSKYQGLLFASIYTLATYRLIDQLVRGALGETLAFAFLPLIVYGLYNIFFLEKNSWLPLALGMSLLIASHLITAFYTAILIAAFLVIYLNKLNLQTITAFGKAVLASVLLSAWFILPYLEQIRHITFNFDKPRMWQTGLDFTLGTLLQNSLSNVGRTSEGLKPNFGILLLLFLLYAIFNYRKLSTTARSLTNATIAMIICSSSLFFWSHFSRSLLAVIQFEWRLLIFVSLLGSFLATTLISRIKWGTRRDQLLIVLWLVTALAYSFNGDALTYGKYKNSYQVTNDNYREYQSSEIGHGREYVVKETNTGLLLDNPFPQSNGFFYVDSADQTIHQYKYDQYTLTANMDTVLQLPKFYYIGYTVTLDGQPTAHYETDGLVSLDITQGEHTIAVEYSGTAIQKWSVYLSGAALLLCLLCQLPQLKSGRKKDARHTMPSK